MRAKKSPRGTELAEEQHHQAVAVTIAGTVIVAKGGRPLGVCRCHSRYRTSMSAKPFRGDRYFIPADLYPEESAPETPNGLGWMATVTAIDLQFERTNARHIAFICDGESEGVELETKTFVSKCIRIAPLPPKPADVGGNEHAPRRRSSGDESDSPDPWMNAKLSVEWPRRWREGTVIERRLNFDGKAGQLEHRIRYDDEGGGSCWHVLHTKNFIVQERSEEPTTNSSSSTKLSVSYHTPREKRKMADEPGSFSLTPDDLMSIDITKLADFKRVRKDIEVMQAESSQMRAMHTELASRKTWIQRTEHESQRCAAEIDAKRAELQALIEAQRSRAEQLKDAKEEVDKFDLENLRTDHTVLNQRINQIQREGSVMLEHMLPHKSSKRNECVICMSKPKTHMLAPCGHQSFCEDCARWCVQEAGTCSVCREHCTAAHEVFD